MTPKELGSIDPLDLTPEALAEIGVKIVQGVTKAKTESELEEWRVATFGRNGFVRKALTALGQGKA